MENLIVPSQASWQRMLTTHAEIIQAAREAHITNGRTFVSFRNAAAMAKRDLSVTNFSTGGALVQNNVEREVIEYLRPKSVLIRAGATVLTNVALPRVLPSLESDPTATWLAENALATESDITVGGRQLTPHRLTTTVTYSKLLDSQSAPDFEATIADACMGALMQGVDAAGLTGTGGVQPAGILNLAGTGEVTFGGAPTWAHVCSFENLLETANVPDDGTVAWLVSPNTAKVWKTTLREGNGTLYLMSEDGKANGKLSFITSELSTTNQVVYVRCSDVVISLLYGGVFIVRDPYTKSDTGESRFTATIYADITMKHVQSAAISLDSAAA